MAFSSQWSRIHDKLALGVRDRALEPDTASLAQIVSERVRIVAEQYLDVYNYTRKLTVEFVSGVDAVLGQSEAPTERVIPNVGDATAYPEAKASTNCTQSVSSPSIHIVSALSLTPEEEQEDTTPPPPVSGFKRRRTSAVTDTGSNLDLETQEVSHRPSKRSRYVLRCNFSTFPSR